ncbi:hypothetical protein ACQVBX_08435 [Dyella sp. KULCS107]|uniref:hypothetical protein n=1 Tax=Dyella sp. KULCS107 TaxID=3422216 RepID=UPI003D6DDC8A
MDLMRILRALEEFLYELVGWLVFYPRTFWRILRDPPASARYVLRELAAPPEKQFAASVSPVLMLILSVVLAHGIEMLSRQSLPDMANPVGHRLFESEQGMLITRCVVFSGYALIAALVTLRRQKQAVTRDTLRGPFAVQAFLISPLVVMLSLGMLLIDLEDDYALPGGALIIFSIVWYVWARIRTYGALTETGWPRATVIVIGTFLGTTALVVAITQFLFR